MWNLRLNPAIVFLTCCLLLATDKAAHAQGFGPELRNTMMPASGGMAGASLARPQDVQSALNGNPATLTQLRGTQFGFNGAWIEPTFNWRQEDGNLPNVGDFAAKSNAQGAALGNVGVTQELRSLGIPMTIGLGLVGTSGAGLSFRDVPESNGTSALLQVLGTGISAAARVTDRLSLGAHLAMGAAVLDAPFVGIGAATTDYGIRGAAGLTYQVDPCTTLGLSYHTKLHFNFDDAITLQLPGGGFGVTQDIDADMPDIVGIALANESLMGGRLLVAADVQYFNWENAALFGSIFDNQWTLQLGTQYKLTDKIRLRMGYVYAPDATQNIPAPNAGGIIPPVVNEAANYLQAQFPNINEHRMTFGIGMRDMLPGVDVDIFAGGMPAADRQYGEFTTVELQSYWVGFGTTWRFGRGSGCCRVAPNEF
jgi:long-chain fatty acid transport protein